MKIKIGQALKAYNVLGSIRAALTDDDTLKSIIKNIGCIVEAVKEKNVEDEIDIDLEPISLMLVKHALNPDVTILDIIELGWLWKN